MKINKSGVSFSSIVGIGEKISKLKIETKEEWLELNRGVNSVTNIDISEIYKNINFNSKEYQLYAPNTGLKSLKENINREYFSNQSSIDNIFVSPGGMPSLDLVMQILQVDNIYFPQFYWGSYSKIATIRNKSFSFYENLDSLLDKDLDDSSCIFICDPSNPTGLKLDDDYLLKMIKKLSNKGCTIVFDSPYRKLFYDDSFFKSLIDDNVIIIESFSKWLGLPGARLGFIHSLNRDFNDELNIRLLYEFNGVSSPSQILINELLSTDIGKISIQNFQKETTENIKCNIEYLNKNNLLVNDIYKGNLPIGIFAIINKTEEFLFKNKIGSVGLDKFVIDNKEKWKQYSRICVSVNHDSFIRFIKNVI